MQQGTPGPTTGGTTAPGATSGTTSGDSGSTTGGAAAPGTNNPPTTTTPAAGANSFTEGQARSRIEAAGYTDVQELRKDEQGVWRGRAMRNGQQADVGLDFQGQVVTGSGTPR
ncbi:PepSY domain-containing protein [Pseudoroseomonas oryzae]|uniref:PepSY domain-containing protein n=2 Tax=Teichococcus oryzae TaxID=1608942 RepID=A0A5B2TDM8_9PROT|nr:PepSY domain-containing protein [Pseudoroseomonas oryzae]